jgi:hypothetical protein
MATARIVSSVEEAARVLDYFNGFHDGFIKRFVIESRDEILADRSQSCTGVFDVRIDFAHYNYQQGAEPFHTHDQIVTTRFSNVQDLFCDFREGFLGNTIISLGIAPATRRKSGGTSGEPCLSLRLGRHYFLEEQRRHEFRESELFTFTEATFID